MDLVLTSQKYKQFLIDFRKADIDAADGDETDVVFESGSVQATYHFQARNFKLFAYSIGGVKTTLTNYNHVGNLGAVDKFRLEKALLAGGGTGSVMTVDLSLVVALTSEAARSRMVEAAMKKAIIGKSVALDPYALLFNSYNQPARYCGYLDVKGGYTKNWKALEKDDYLRFFASSTFTGNGPVFQAAVNNLFSS